jgi:hypothetical protein
MSRQEYYFKKLQDLNSIFKSPEGRLGICNGKAGDAQAELNSK